MRALQRLVNTKPNMGGCGRSDLGNTAIRFQIFLLCGQYGVDWYQSQPQGTMQTPDWFHGHVADSRIRRIVEGGWTIGLDRAYPRPCECWITLNPWCWGMCYMVDSARTCSLSVLWPNIRTHGHGRSDWVIELHDPSQYDGWSLGVFSGMVESEYNSIESVTALFKTLSTVRVQE